MVFFIRLTGAITGALQAALAEVFHPHAPNNQFRYFKGLDNKFAKYATPLSWHGLKNIRSTWVFTMSLFCS